jgi:hypothetical protein
MRRAHQDPRSAWCRKELGHVFADYGMRFTTDADDDMCRGVAEVEAESIAYVVLASQGVRTEDNSVPCIAGWAEGGIGLVWSTMARSLDGTRRILDLMTPSTNGVCIPSRDPRCASQARHRVGLPVCRPARLTRLIGARFGHDCHGHPSLSGLRASRVRWSGSNPRPRPGSSSHGATRTGCWRWPNPYCLAAYLGATTWIAPLGRAGSSPAGST